MPASGGIDVRTVDAAAETDRGEKIRVGHGRGTAFDPETGVEVCGDVGVAVGGVAAGGGSKACAFVWWWWCWQWESEWRWLAV